MGQTLSSEEFQRRYGGNASGERLSVEEFQARYQQARKYPTAAERGAPAGTATMPEPPRWATFPREVTIGAGKGIASTMLGVSRMVGAVPEDARLEHLGIQPPETTAEKVGFGAEQIGEFFVPGATAGKIPKVAALLGKSGKAGMGIRAGSEAVGAGTVSMAQSGGDIKLASLDAAIDASFTAAFGAFTPLLKHGARKAMNATISPGRTDFAQGFDVDTIFKYKLQAGSVAKMTRKVNKELSRLAGELKAAIAKHGNVEVDVIDLLDDAVKEIRGKGTRFAFQITDLPAAEKRMLDVLQVSTPTGKMGLLDAQGLKQAVGEMGAFAENNPAIELRSLELLANTYYQKLRKALEVGAPEVKKINQSLSEIIPINDALIRRLPAAEKARLFELGELVVLSGGAEVLMGGGSAGRVATGTAGLLLLNRMMRSPTGGRVMHAAGRGAASTGMAVGRTAAGLTPAERQPH